VLLIFVAAEQATTQEIQMSQAAKDLTELRFDFPASLELRRIAANLIAAGVASDRGGL
jgi:hypothetical protein